jgi:hypothetical protein
MLTSIDTRSCVLFLGSGFVRDGKNILNDAPPLGDGLRKSLSELLDDADYENYDMQTISDAVLARDNLDLYQHLYNLFTMKEVPESHVRLLKMPWRRIYTTNYDDSVELILPSVRSFNYDEPCPKKIPLGSLIHLHGVIRSANRDNIANQVILGERSYVRLHFDKSQWFSELYRDIRYSDATFFVGYSLRDHHISSLLMQSQDTKGKVFFITSGEPKKPEAERFNLYGRVEPIGVAGLVDCIGRLPKPNLSSLDLSQLRSLRFLDPLQDRASLTPPTAPEVRHLLTFGTLNFKRLIAGLHDQSYAVTRKRKLAEALDAVGCSRTLIVDSHIGNGKTVFLHIMAAVLSSNRYKCFICRSDVNDVSKDIEILKAAGKIAIIFDSYSVALDVIREFEQVADAIFIVAVRSSVRAIQMHEIIGSFPAPVSVLNLNQIDRDDRDALRSLASKSGLISPDFERKLSSSHDFRELVLSIYSNSSVRKSIETELVPALNSDRAKRLFLTCYIIKQSGHDADPVFVRDIIGDDPYVLLGTFGPVAHELFSGGDGIELRSSSFSRYIVDNYFDARDIASLLEKLILAAARRREKRSYRRMLGAFMQVSFLRNILLSWSNADRTIEEIFEKIRHDSIVNMEPLFWLQYSILMVDRDIDISEDFVRTSYVRAGAMPGFQTYQIDTFALHLFLRAEILSTGNSVVRFDDISERVEAVAQMLSDSSHRYYAINALSEFESFVRSRSPVFTDHQKLRLVYHLRKTARALADLPTSYKAESGSEATRISIERAIAILTN